MFKNIKEKIISFFLRLLKFKKVAKKNIWKRLKENREYITILAPMLDVTDRPFREIVAELGAPDLFFTEFVSIDGLASEKGRKRLEVMLKASSYEKRNKNLILQIFGSNPEKVSKAFEVINKYNFSGIDINMGCPDKKIIKQGAGSGMMRDFESARKIFEAVKKETFLPVSIKTRLGYSKIDWEWIRFVLSLKPDALTFHLRTTKEMSKVPAHWEVVKKIRELRDEISPETILVGNGDLEGLKEAEEKVLESCIDGVMIGRGIFKNPALFAREDFGLWDKKKKFQILIRHGNLFEEEFGGLGKNYKKFGKRLKSFNLMKKFFKIYLNGFDGTKELRVKLMEMKNWEEIKKEIRNIYWSK